MSAATFRDARAEREATAHLVADKRMTAMDAATLVRDGDHVAIGGTCYSRTPMALLFALLKLRRRRLTISRPLSSYEAELFLATGAAERIVTSWVGIGLRYRAGAMGLPFLPALSMLGSDLAPAVGLRMVTCPYTGERLAAIPALNPDVALIHSHRADMYGNAQVDGYRHMDMDMARAARRVVVSAERIVSTGEISSQPG